MVSAWGGYNNGDIPLSAMVAVQGQYFEPDMAARMTYLLSQFDVHINEGYRPRGIESDQYVTNEAYTSTGGSNQWFQWGRYQRGETPSAGWPPAGTSHGWGLAADINPGRGTAQVAALCAQLGLVFTIDSEPWHVAADGIPTIDYQPKDDTKKRKRNMVWVGCNANGGHWLVAPGYIRQTNWFDSGEAVLKQAVGDIVVVQTEAQLLNFFALLDISADVYKALPSLPNRTWSRELELIDKVGKIGGTGGATADQVATAVDKKLAPSFSAIPKTVNDDAAKRMSN